MKPESARLFDRIKTSKNLPSLPHILLKLIDACNNQAGSIEEISEIISKDSSLSARVMKMVNSAFYGLSVRVTSVNQALLMLGTEAVKNIAVSAAVFRVFGVSKGDDAFRLKQFWYHGLLCATVAELIAKKTSYSSSDEAFLSGLLHDIGKLVLWVNFPKDYAQILKSDTGPDAVGALERKHFGADHAEVGAWMIGQWHLQSFMADAVLYHHEPNDRIKDALPLVKIVCLANALSKGEGNSARALEIAQALFGFSPDDVEALVADGRQNVEEVAQSLGIEIESPQASVALSEKEHQKEIALLRNVRDVSLLQGTLQNLLDANGQQAILAVITQGLQVLFDIDQILFLLYDPKEKALVGKGGMQSPQEALIKELAIPFEGVTCLAVRCLAAGDSLDSFGQLKDVPLTILDRQLVRLVGTDGILCVPMSAHAHHVGVIVLGVDQPGLSLLSNQMSLLTMFSRQAALALYADGMREAQARLVQTERLAAASAIAKKVVHEVNNPLGIIKNYLKILGMKLPKDDAAQTDLKIIGEELDRVALIVGRLADFSEPEAKQTEPVDINALVSDLIRIIKASLGRDAKVKLEAILKPSLPTVFSEKNALKQVLINLIKNAAEAMPDGGRLFISTDYIPKRRMESSGDAALPGGSVEIQVRDEGPGIPEGVRSRLFEPFVSSKQGAHAGLGLSVAYNIVRDLQGTLSYQSTPGQGTTFTVSLPVGTGPAA
ncbi:MAG: HDOD domain-containing protein [Deltaproteobacteria bacterium]|nr:HDOD domain-containing protein [Deltaproteobacteria bacterium]